MKVKVDILNVFEKKSIQPVRRNLRGKFLPPPRKVIFKCKVQFSTKS